eukprot:1845450-Amphidinium_carterae.2
MGCQAARSCGPCSVSPRLQKTVHLQDEVAVQLQASIVTATCPSDTRPDVYRLMQAQCVLPAHV